MSTIARAGCERLRRSHLSNFREEWTKKLIAVAALLIATMTGASASLKCRIGDVTLFQIDFDAANVVHFCIRGKCKDRVLIKTAPRGTVTDWVPADDLRPGFKVGDELTVKDFGNPTPETFSISVGGDFGPAITSAFGIVQCGGLLKADPRPGKDVVACDTYIKNRHVSVLSIDGSNIAVFYENLETTPRTFPPLAPGSTDLGRGVTAYSINGEITILIDGVLTTCSQN